MDILAASVSGISVVVGAALTAWVNLARSRAEAKKRKFAVLREERKRVYLDILWSLRLARAEMLMAAQEVKSDGSRFQRWSWRVARIRAGKSGVLLSSSSSAAERFQRAVLEVRLIGNDAIAAELRASANLYCDWMLGGGRTLSTAKTQDLNEELDRREVEVLRLMRSDLEVP